MIQKLKILYYFFKLKNWVLIDFDNSKTLSCENIQKFEGKFKLQYFSDETLKNAEKEVKQLINNTLNK